MPDKKSNTIWIIIGSVAVVSLGVGSIWFYKKTNKQLQAIQPTNSALPVNEQGSSFSALPVNEQGSSLKQNSKTPVKTVIKTAQAVKGQRFSRR